MCVCAEEDEDAERREGKCVKGGRRVDTPGIVVGEQHTEHAPACAAHRHRHRHTCTTNV